MSLLLWNKKKKGPSLGHWIHSLLWRYDNYCLPAFPPPLAILFKGARQTPPRGRLGNEAILKGVRKRQNPMHWCVRRGLLLRQVPVTVHADLVRCWHYFSHSYKGLPFKSQHTLCWCPHGCSCTAADYFSLIEMQILIKGRLLWIFIHFQ